ncbi:MAG: protoporphyrinogen oxidase [Nocardioidaceae bacterium]
MAGVVVVGAGISGLAAAAGIRRLDPELDVLVLESSPRIGGKLRTETVGGVQVDVGAESMLNRRPEAVTLAADSGVDLVYPATTSANIWTRGRLRPMPRSLMGVPADLKELGATGILSRSGQARALLDQVLPATRIGSDDVSVGWLVEERFGKELLDRLVEPLLGGVYAGHAREISARAAIPQVIALLDKDRSLSHGVARSWAPLGAAGSPQAPVFAGIEGGVGTLPGAVVAAHGLRVETGTTVRRVVRSGTGWNLVVGATTDPRVIEADAVVIATPAAATARLLADEVPDAALELARIETASMAVVTMAFPERDFPAIDGSGFLVPPVDGRTIKAATYSFGKWGWVREHGSGEGLLVMRASVGRHREESVLQVPDEELVAAAVDDLADAIGLSLRPVDSHVQRWGGGLPQYAVGHLDRVARVRAAVARQPGLAVAGASYEGIGIPACIRSGQLAAAQVVAAGTVSRE